MTTQRSTRARKVALGAGVLLTSLGISGSAYAATGSSSTSPTPSTATKSHHPKLRALLKHSVVDTRVVHTKNGYVTLESIKGTVSTVDPTSITVTAGNGTAVTATIGSKTRFVRLTQASITTGEQVGLVEVGSTARLIVGPKPAAPATS
jgi:hypothetical protein